MPLNELSRPRADVGHCLQTLVLAAEPGCEPIYGRQIGVDGVAIPPGDMLSIAPGYRLLLDSLANSFFERYWRDLTGLATLTFTAETSGACAIRVVRRCPGRPERVIAEAAACGRRVRTTLPVDLCNRPIEDAVIHAEIAALDETSELHEGAWRTDDPARGDVRLAIVICSFGREATVVDNLRRLAPVVDQTPEIASLLIVHQGTSDLARLPAYEALMTGTSFGNKLRLVRQDNFGGSGGFTRGILESLDANASHILLLDDDVRIEPAVIERLTTLVARLKRLTTIGGQMLNLHRPTTLHASHESVDFRRLRLSNPCKDIELNAACLADLFGQRHAGDYNAWWFCCIPAATFRAIGLPMPMFIRFDDIEYGVRTVRSGTEVVTMPGIFVWHEPFGAKNGTPSFVYYERRNFMIASALHAEAAAFHFLRQHWTGAWSSLRKHRYDYCWALCRAVDDFLQGPASNFSAIDARHRQLVADQQRVTLMTMAGLRHHMARAKGAGGRRPQSPLTGLVRRPSDASTADAKFAAMTRQLAYTIVRTSLALVLRTRRVAAAYRIGAPTYSSPAFWSRLLAMPGPERPA